MSKYYTLHVHDFVVNHSWVLAEVYKHDGDNKTPITDLKVGDVLKLKDSKGEFAYIVSNIFTSRSCNLQADFAYGLKYLPSMNNIEKTKDIKYIDIKKIFKAEHSNMCEYLCDAYTTIGFDIKKDDDTLQCINKINISKGDIGHYYNTPTVPFIITLLRNGRPCYAVKNNCLKDFKNKCVYFTFKTKQQNLLCVVKFDDILSFLNTQMVSVQPVYGVLLSDFIDNKYTIELDTFLKYVFKDKMELSLSHGSVCLFRKNTNGKGVELITKNEFYKKVVNTKTKNTNKIKIDGIIVNHVSNDVFEMLCEFFEDEEYDLLLKTM